MAGQNPDRDGHGAEPLGPDASVEDIQERVAYLSGTPSAAATETEPPAAPDDVARHPVPRRRRRGGCLSVVVGAVAGWVVAAAVLPAASISILRLLPAASLSCQNLDGAMLVAFIVMMGEALVLAAGGVFIAARGWRWRSGGIERPLLTDGRLGWVVGTLVAGAMSAMVLSLLGCAL